MISESLNPSGEPINKMGALTIKFREFQPSSDAYCSHPVILPPPDTDVYV
jgi:hypothetical protein